MFILKYSLNFKTDDIFKGLSQTRINKAKMKCLLHNKNK